MKDSFSIKLGYETYLNADIKRTFEIQVDAIARKITKKPISYNFIFKDYQFKNALKEFVPVAYKLHNLDVFDYNVSTTPLNQETKLLPEHTKVTVFSADDRTLTFPLYNTTDIPQNGTYKNYNDLVSKMLPLAEEIATEEKLKELLTIQGISDETKNDIEELIKDIKRSPL